MKILACTDGSATSLAVLPQVWRLAKLLDAKVVLVRVLDPRVDGASEIAPQLEDALAVVEARWRGELEKLLDDAHVQGSVMVPRREWGKDVADAIRETADVTGADLVAMATRGAGVLRHVLLGSVAMGIISKTDIPVLTVAGDPPLPAGEGPYHVVVTTDGSPNSRSIFTALAPILVPGKVKLTILEVIRLRGTESVESARLRLEALSELVPAGVETTVHVKAVPESANIAASVIDAALDLGADAIASATHGHSARRHLIAGSTALGVVGNAGLPVILARSRPIE